MGKKRKQTSSKLEFFYERLATIVGRSFVQDIKKTFVEKPTTFRVNTLLSTRKDVEELLKQSGFTVRRVPWYSDAFILQNKSKRELMNHVLFEKGYIYVQSLASMVPPIVLNAKPGERVLDLTAAPGSKTSQIASYMEKTGELVANDKDQVRFFKLEHNMKKLGVIDEEKEDWKFTLTNEPGERLCREYNEYFDKILLDAPCSAESRFIEGKPKTYSYWSEKKVEELARLQRRLLKAAWSALKPGGILVYSTCTMAPEENELQISRFISECEDEVTLLPIAIDGLRRLSLLKDWQEKGNSKKMKHMLRIMPTKDIEGFFIVKLQKA